MTSIRSTSPRSGIISRAFAVAALGLASLVASGCYDCLYCDGPEQVDGWARFDFVEAEGGAPMAGLPVVFNTGTRSLDRTTNGSGAVVLQDLAGNTLNFTLSLPQGYAFETPASGMVIVSFTEDTTSTSLTVIPPPG